MARAAASGEAPPVLRRSIRHRRAGTKDFVRMVEKLFRSALCRTAVYQNVRRKQTRCVLVYEEQRKSVRQNRTFQPADFPDRSNFLVDGARNRPYPPRKIICHLPNKRKGNRRCRCTLFYSS